MITYHSLRCESLRDRQQTQMTRAELRDLVERLDLHIGSRLLLAGEATHGLAPFFTGLGIDVSAIGESVYIPASAESEATLSGMPFPAAMFDAVLTSDLSVYSQSLFHDDALQTTALLATLIRPGGKFAVLHAADSDSHHDDGCFKRHFQRFAAEVFLVALGIRRGWLLSRTSTATGRMRLIVMDVPTTRRSHVIWFALATRTGIAKPTNCCARIPAASPRRTLSEAA